MFEICFKKMSMNLKLLLISINQINVIKVYQRNILRHLETCQGLSDSDFQDFPYGRIVKLAKPLSDEVLLTNKTLLEGILQKSQ